MKKIVTTSKDRIRLLVTSLGCLLLFSALIVKFYYLQIDQASHWEATAVKQHYTVIEEPFKRGGFIAESIPKRPHPLRTIPLVLDLKQYHLYADPAVFTLTNKVLTAQELAARIPEHDANYFFSQLDRTSRSRKLVRGFSPEDRRSLEKWWFAFAKAHKIPRNALFFIPDWCRQHPCGDLLAQVLHTVQAMKNEQTKQAIPTGGLELALDPLLRGNPGKRKLMRSPRHTFESADLLVPVKDGLSVTLTIDPYLQAIAEEEIEKGVIKSRAKGGWVVLMDPHSGDILALAQYPFFDPEKYSLFFSDPLLAEHTRLKAVTDANEPGSVMKAITLSIALLANEELEAQGKPPLFTLDEKVATSDSRFPGRSKPLIDTHLHHFLNFNMAMQKSSNIYCARMIDRVLKSFGNEWYRKKLQECFGFGVRTGIEYPGETPGVIPTPGKKHANGKLEWSVATPYSLAMGYNIQANSIQLVRAYSVIANGGHLVQPRLIRKAGSREIPQAAPVKVLSEKNTRIIADAMRFVIKPGGSALRADIPGYTEAGKSSTAKKLVNGAYAEKLYLSSFAGFAPVKNPSIVLLVTMDEPEYGFIPGYGRNHHGGNCAGQVFRRIGKRSLEYLGIEKDDPWGYPQGDPRRDVKRIAWHQETIRLQENYEKWNKH